MKKRPFGIGPIPQPPTPFPPEPFKYEMVYYRSYDTAN